MWTERQDNQHIEMEVIEMPYGDRTEPIRQGLRTGIGRGFCSIFDLDGSVKRKDIFPYGGRCYTYSGGGHGHRNMYYATALPGWLRGGRNFPFSCWTDVNDPSAFTPSEKLEILKNEAARIENLLQEIKQHISDMESDPCTGEDQTGG